MKLARAALLLSLAAVAGTAQINVGDQKPEAVAVALNPASGQIQFRGQHQHTLAIRQQLTVSLHGDQPSIQAFKIKCRDAQAQGQVCRCHRRLCSTQTLEYFFARRRNPRPRHSSCPIKISLLFL